MFKRLRDLINRPIKQNPFEFLFVTVFVAIVLGFSRVKKINLGTAMGTVLVDGLKAALVLILGLLALAIFLSIQLYFYSSFNKFKFKRSRAFTQKKMSFKDSLFRMVLSPILILWIIGMWIKDLLLTRRWPGPGFKYVYVNEDGTARELDEKERNYLLEEFDPTDGARPYIKFGYGAMTPTGKISGFLLRRHLPRHIEIKQIPPVHRNLK